MMSAFPIAPPIEPMLSKAAETIPSGPFLYEPKWDGFRAIVFRDGDEILTQSRDLKPLDRYFPELADPLREIEVDVGRFDRGALPGEPGFRGGNAGLAALELTGQ